MKYMLYWRSQQEGGNPPEVMHSAVLGKDISPLVLVAAPANRYLRSSNTFPDVVIAMAYMFGCLEIARVLGEPSG
jgi:hypothetical protein